MVYLPFNLNTSYVKVQPYNIILNDFINRNLNTSYVKVQHTVDNVILLQETFKYILC